MDTHLRFCSKGVNWRDVFLCKGHSAMELIIRVGCYVKKKHLVPRHFCLICIESAFLEKTRNFGKFLKVSHLHNFEDRAMHFFCILFSIYLRTDLLEQIFKF